MSGFVNTVEIVGDDALTDSIIQRSISGALNDDQATRIGVNAFRRCGGLTGVKFPSVVTTEMFAFAWCTGLVTADFSAIESMEQRTFGWCRSLRSLIIRNPQKVCSLSGPFQDNPAFANGQVYIYVPAVLANSYAGATNWSIYANNILALEDWTDDGTIYGALTFAGYAVSYRLSLVSSSNSVSKTGRRYTTTLTASTEIEEVSITMGGVDITAEVYNAETGEINIPLVTGDLVITAKAAWDESLVRTEPIHSFTAANATSTAWVDEVDGSYQFNFTGSPTIGDGYVNFTSSSNGTLNKTLGLTGVDCSLVIRFVADPGKTETWVMGSPNFASGVIIGKKGGYFHVESSSGPLIRLASADANEHEVAVCFEASSNTLYAYFDGVRRGSMTGEKLAGWLSGMLVLNNEGAAYNGANKVAHVKIYPAVLTDDEVVAIFAQGGTT